MELHRTNGVEVGREQGPIRLQDGHGPGAVVVSTWSRQERPHVGAVLMRADDDNSIITGGRAVDADDLKLALGCYAHDKCSAYDGALSPAVREGFGCDELLKRL